MSNFILGAIVGFLIGLAIVYGKQIWAVYENRDQISAVVNLADATQNAATAFGVKL
jgi:hypothetical protein